MVKTASAFILSTTVTYTVLASVFALYCIIGGHNLLEMLYGSSATVVLSLVAGVELACRAAKSRKSMRN